MANSDDIATYFAGELARVADRVSEAELAWLRQMLQCFPVPSVQLAPHLILSIDRVMRAASWGPQLLPPDFGAALRGIVSRAERLRDALPDIYGPLHIKDIRGSLGGDYLLARALVTDGFPVPKGHESLRLVLIVCRWRWSASDSPRISAINALASAIRAGERSILDQQMLLDMGRAPSVPGFLIAAAPLAQSEHTTLASAWRRHYEPELRSIMKPQADFPGPELQPFTPSPSSPDVEHDGLKSVADDLKSGLRKGLPPAPTGAPSPLAGEMIDEVVPAVDISPLPFVPQNADAAGLARYHVQQAIWSRNTLLLANHPDVLPLSDYVQVVRALTSTLAELEQEHELRYGALALLLQALTGRAPRTLGAMRVLRKDSAAHDPSRIELLLDERAFRLSPFWQVTRGAYVPSYFSPSDDQRLYLEQPAPYFLLPIEQRVFELLNGRAAGLFDWLRSNPIADTEASLRHAAHHLREVHGLQVTPGRVRSSFSAHLFESCHDVAATQLICADSLGQSIAPLAYYAPTARSLAAIYWHLQCRLLEIEEPMPAYPLGDVRIGSGLLVEQSRVKQLARAVASVRHVGIARLEQENRWRDIHQAMVSQLGAMLLAVATHRPGQALLQLTLSDFWLDGDLGAALFRDKLIDAAHDPRLVALPRTVCRQLQVYLEHLVGMTERIRSLDSHVTGVLAGRSPLLFGLTMQKEPLDLDWDTWKAGLPSSWREVQLNWGRHWVRTHGIEQGIQPELVNTQMGHLEVVGYPFSDVSPTEPWLFVEELSPKWETLARAQGWQVVRGVPARDPITPRTLTPLHLWDRRIKEHETRLRALQATWRTSMKAKRRSYREAAEAAVLGHPELVEAGITARYRQKQTQVEPHSLTREEFERIRDQLYEAAGDDLALALARADALFRIAKVVNKRTRQTAATPTPMFVPRRPLDNAFIPGMLEAVRQVHALREHVSALPARLKCGSEMKDACARTILALLLFGYCDDLDRVFGALGRRDQLQRSASLQDRVLVPWGDEPHQVIALQGVAACAFARLAWKHRGERVPGRREMEVFLMTMLPDWATQQSRLAANKEGGLLLRLCETVSVANRYELSPASRRMNAATSGATPAHIREQLAFIDGDPAGTIERDWEAKDRPAENGSGSRNAAGRKGNARSQYLALCAVLPAAGRDTKLPLTGVVIRPNQAATPRTRMTIVEELQKQLASSRPETALQPIVHLLAGWVIDMVVNGTARRANPALSTVKTYLTRIGGPLVNIFGQSSLHAVDEAELEDAYIAAIECSVKSRQQAAAAVLSFHHYAQIAHEIPELDLSSVRLYLSNEREALADARLILPSERDATLKRLALLAASIPASTDHNQMRIRRQAAQALPLMALGGLRRGEAFGIQFRDLSATGDHLRVEIRPNSKRRLKTSSARRKVEIPLNSTRVAGMTLLDCVEAERKRLPSQRLETAFVFSGEGARSDTSVCGDIATVCVQAYGDVTGRESSRLHAYRHLVAMERTIPVFLSESDRAALAPQLQLSPAPTQHENLALPRDLLGKVVTIGHRGPSINLRSYNHLPWLLRSRSEALLTKKYMRRSIVAPLLGVTHHTLDWAIKQRPGRTKEVAWLDVQAKCRQVPVLPGVRVADGGADGAATSAEVHGQWTARQLGKLLTDVARVGSLQKVLVVIGADLGDEAAIRMAVRAMEGRIGRRLLIEPARPSDHARPKRSLRRTKEGAQLDALLDYCDAESGVRDELEHLADVAHEYMESNQRDRIHLPLPAAEQLQRLLVHAGVSGSQISMVQSGPGMLAIQVRGAAGRSCCAQLKLVLLLIRCAARLRRAAQRTT